MYHFIINPKSSSGKGIKHWWTVKKELDDNNIPYTFILTEYPGHATELVERLCSEYADIKNIVVLGGDGTLNEVINGIKNYKEVLLGYIPSGSSNDLARSLKIPKDPLKALSNILKPKNFKYLDHGRITFLDCDVEPRTFCCSSGMGYDANVCLEVQESSLKKRLNQYGAGKFVYFAIAFKQLLKNQPSEGTVIIDGVKKYTYKKILLSSNMIHKYEGGGLMMAPDADPSDGKLSVCLVHDFSKLRLFLLLPTIIFGKHVKYKGVETFHCSEIEIKVKQKMAVHTDGEVPAVCSHIKVDCLPEQIRMIL